MGCEGIGGRVGLAVDANQRWNVEASIDWLKQFAPYNVAWAEEPTSPHDVLGHAVIRRAVAPMRISTRDHTQNRVIFKPLIQAQAGSPMPIDSPPVRPV